jgi:hypothetical protein
MATRDGNRRRSTCAPRRGYTNNHQPCTADQGELRMILDRLERTVARYRWALSRLEAGEDPDAIADEWARLAAAEEER